MANASPGTPAAVVSRAIARLFCIHTTTFPPPASRAVAGATLRLTLVATKTGSKAAKAVAVAAGGPAGVAADAVGAGPAAAPALAGAGAGALGPAATGADAPAGDGAAAVTSLPPPPPPQALSHREVNATSASRLLAALLIVVCMTVLHAGEPLAGSAMVSVPCHSCRVGSAPPALGRNCCCEWMRRGSAGTQTFVAPTQAKWLGDCAEVPTSIRDLLASHVTNASTAIQLCG